MDSIQHHGAKKLLKVISKVRDRGDFITYREAAKLIGRFPPERHSRATAQMCDLLDAAACLAGVPLLALLTVRNQSNKINPKAWKKEGVSRRNAIIARSVQHQFSPPDYQAIGKAIDDLGQRGNQKAWAFVKSKYTGDQLYRRLIGDLADAKSNAIDDIGTDTPDRTKSEVWAYDRDLDVRNAVLKRANGKYEFCGEIGFLKKGGGHYLEAHHIIALAKDGEDRLTNVIALCPNDHREAHFSARHKTIEKQMILILESMV